jgi:hypothetical protein
MLSHDVQIINGGRKIIKTRPYLALSYFTLMQQSPRQVHSWLQVKEMDFSIV